MGSGEARAAQYVGGGAGSGACAAGCRIGAGAGEGLKGGALGSGGRAWCSRRRVGRAGGCCSVVLCTCAPVHVWRRIPQYMKHPVYRDAVAGIGMCNPDTDEIISYRGGYWTCYLGGGRSMRPKHPVCHCFPAGARRRSWRSRTAASSGSLRARGRRRSREWRGWCRWTATTWRTSSRCGVRRCAGAYADSGAGCGRWEGLCNIPALCPSCPLHCSGSDLTHARPSHAAGWAAQAL